MLKIKFIFTNGLMPIESDIMKSIIKVKDEQDCFNNKQGFLEKCYFNMKIVSY